MPPLAIGNRLEWLWFTIYSSPADYPDQVVVRAMDIHSQRNPANPVPLDVAWTFPSVQAAREAIRETKPAALCFLRDSSDPTSIVESWF